MKRLNSTLVSLALLDLLIVIFIALVVWGFIGITSIAHAETAVIITPHDNPCNEIYGLIDAQNKLDTGNDENFKRIMQQNNREIIMRCQQWQESYTRSAPSIQYYDYRRGY